MRNKRRVAIWLIQLGITGGTLSYLLYLIPAHKIFESLRQASLAYFVLGLLISVVNHALTAYQMKVTLKQQTIDLNTARVFSVNLMSSFYNLFLPGFLAGGVIRWLHFSKDEGKRAQAMAAILFNRIVEVLTLVAMGLLFWILEKHSSGDLGQLSSLLFILVSISAVYILSFNRHFYILLEYLNNLKFNPKFVQERALKLIRCLTDFDRAKGVFHLHILSLSILRHGVGLLSLYCFALALQIHVSVVTIGWIRSLFTLITTLPITISGLGVREATFVYSLRGYGVDPEVAMAFSFLVFFRGFCFALAGAVLELKRVHARARSMK